MDSPLTTCGGSSRSLDRVVGLRDTDEDVGVVQNGHEVLVDGRVYDDQRLPLARSCGRSEVLATRRVPDGVYERRTGAACTRRCCRAGGSLS